MHICAVGDCRHRNSLRKTSQLFTGSSTKPGLHTLPHAGTAVVCGSMTPNILFRTDFSYL